MFNMIIEGDSLEVIKRIDDESIDIVITSPPYNAGHDYDTYDDNKEDVIYLMEMKNIFEEVFRVLKDDGRICINVPFAIKNRKTKKVSFLAHKYAAMLNDIGFKDFEWITWHKGKNKNHFQGNNTAWGSWKSPSCPSFRPMGEAVMVFFKNDRRMVRDKNKVDITGDEFKNWTKNLWYFDEEEELYYDNIIMEPNTANKKEHPAPYPIELIERLLKLYSYRDCIVLDPFNGTGTTTLAAQNLKRKFIGIDLSKKYCDIAFKRLKNHKTKRLSFNSNFSDLVNSDDVNNSINEYFPYKESFSPKLYNELMDRYDIENVEIMYDPFLGTGSSFINSKAKIAYGVDVSPFALNVSKAKLNPLCNKSLKKAYKLAENIDSINIKSYKIPDWPPYTKYVEVEKFNIVKSVIEEYYSISSDIGKFIEYLIYSNLEHIFDYKRDGNGIKFRKSDINKSMLKTYLSTLIKGALNAKRRFDGQNKLKKIYLEKNCSKGFKPKELVDLVITSPPYVNMFDYFEVYKIELWTSGLIKSYDDWRKLKKSALRSNLNADLNQYQKIDNILLKSSINELNLKQTNSRTVNMINNYFYDMRLVLKNLYEVMKKDSYVFIVVGNSFYSGVPIVTDYILAEEAEKLGFINEDIIFARKLRTSPQQMKIITDSDKVYLRESVIVLRKE